MNKKRRIMSNNLPWHEHDNFVEDANICIFGFSAGK